MKTLKSLKHHVATIHAEKREKSEKSHFCEKCGLGYVREIDLKIHFSSVHEGNKPYICELCGASYAAQRKLNRHHREMHINNKEPLHVCPHCSKPFLDEKKLSRHIEMRHGKENFKDVSEDLKSKVWKKFLLDKKLLKAKCITCSAVISVRGKGSDQKDAIRTGPLHGHLKAVHFTTLPKLAGSRES